MEIHVVQAGETLYGIAGQYGVDPELLGLANGVPAGGALAVGQTLVIEQGSPFHIVQPGQTLSAIARLYGMGLRALYRNNYWLLGNPAIQPGQKLVIAYQGGKSGSRLYQRLRLSLHLRCGPQRHPALYDLHDPLYLRH